MVVAGLDLAVAASVVSELCLAVAAVVAGLDFAPAAVVVGHGDAVVLGVVPPGGAGGGRPVIGARDRTVFPAVLPPDVRAGGRRPVLAAVLAPDLVGLRPRRRGGGRDGGVVGRGATRGERGGGQHPEGEDRDRGDELGACVLHGRHHRPRPAKRPPTPG